MKIIVGDRDYLFMDEVSELTGIPVDTLRYYRMQQGRGEDVGPPSFRMGRRVKYLKSELQAWIRAQEEQERARRGGDAA
jgi:predicted DNA-binding transcriptional regulator AlpA